jgi:hypothetical protein
MEITVPAHLHPLADNTTLQDVIAAINVDRALRLAIYLAPSVRWSDNRGSSIEIVEASLNL